MIEHLIPNMLTFLVLAAWIIYLCNKVEYLEQLNRNMRSDIWNLLEKRISEYEREKNMMTTLRNKEGSKIEKENES